MKKKSLFVLTALSALSLAACGSRTATSSTAATSSAPAVSSVEVSSVAPSSEEPKLAGIEDFCKLFDGEQNATVAIADQSVYKMQKDIVLVDYTEDIESAGYIDNGYIIVDGKGMFTYSADASGATLGDLFSSVTAMQPYELVGSLQFIADNGDEVWKDTDDANVFKSTNGKLMTEASEFVGETYSASYCEYAQLAFDDVNNIKKATVTLHYDESSYYEGEEPFDVVFTISDVGTTSISYYDSLVKQAEAFTGLTGTWSDEQKAEMTAAAGSAFPEIALSQYSYDYYNEDELDYGFTDLNPDYSAIADFEAEFVKLGFTLNTYNSYSESGYISDYYEKFIYEDDVLVGVYTVYIGYLSAATYASYYGEDYGVLFPKGTLTVEASQTTYMQYNDLLKFFGNMSYGGIKIQAPSFTEAPTKIVYSDLDVTGYSWGLTFWRKFEGTFSTQEVAISQLTTYLRSLLEDKHWSEYDIYTVADLAVNYQVMLIYTADDGTTLTFTVLIDYYGTGGFSFDIEE